MALQKRTKIAIGVAAVIVIVIVVGLLLGLLLKSNKIAPSEHNPVSELQVWPRGADGSANPLIAYKSADHSSVASWVERINTSLTGNGYGSHPENLVTCNFFHGPKGNQVCDVPMNEFYPCTADNQYNYKKAAPCVFLRLDNVVGWAPLPYNVTEDLPAAMPEELKREIKSVSGKPEANEVWVTCEGVEAADKELLGSVKYIPRRGLPTYYFPYTNQKGYLSPLVAVLFEKPRTNILINVECKAWAKNIVDCKKCEPSSSVRFSLRVD